MAIPTRILEQINNSELSAKDFYSTYGKENIDTALGELKKSDEEILASYSVEDMRRAVTEKLMKNANQSNGGRRNTSKGVILSFPVQRIVGCAAAAMLLAAIIIPAGLKNSTIDNSPVPTERIKGSADSLKLKETQLKLYRQKGREIQALENGSFARPGDVIQITYDAGKQEYGVIFSVDGNGNVTRHFPEHSWQAAQLIHRADETPLDFSYELDNAPDFECFVMVTSTKEFNLSDIEKRIKNKTDIEYLKSMSYLPKKTEGISFILEK